MYELLTIRRDLESLGIKKGNQIIFKCKNIAAEDSENLFSYHIFMKKEESQGVSSIKKLFLMK
ncbi:hypothetical protein [Xenorhabdus koppenhoeferi]|uniref:Uncharacterized protein n=2 Tax=Xenorhabdus koppenhoeferi TaxID=351659 RepID=A0A1I7HLQ3_9GAMM|nr:hypothetical protein SAMN05421784_11516 [Xenorhabdus koppenhoeferi]